MSEYEQLRQLLSELIPYACRFKLDGEGDVQIYESEKPIPPALLQRAADLALPLVEAICLLAFPDDWNVTREILLRRAVAMGEVSAETIIAHALPPAAAWREDC